MINTLKDLQEQLDIKLTTIILKIKSQCQLDPISFSGGVSGCLIKTGIHLAATGGCPNHVLREEINIAIKKAYKKMILAYPINKTIVLGIPEAFELMIEPDIGIELDRVTSNTPAPGMFIIKDSVLFYEHDTFNVGPVPSKKRKLSLNKNHLKKLHIEYNGWIPRGYLGGMTFPFNYIFIGEASD